jgi:hypothetical protein
LPVVKRIGTDFDLNEQSIRPICCFDLSGGFAILQAPMFDGSSFDPLSIRQDEFHTIDGV